MFDSKKIASFFPGQHVILIYGVGGAGKTCCCLVRAVDIALQGKKVIFLDTENGFPVERVKQISGDDHRRVLKNIILFPLKSFKNQQLKLKGLPEIISKTDVGLIVVDSINYHYRRLVRRKKELANNMLESQMKALNKIGMNIPVMITSQVYSDVNDDSIAPIGKVALSKHSSTIIRLENNPRRLIMDKPLKKSCRFEIVEEGVI